MMLELIGGLVDVAFDVFFQVEVKSSCSRTVGLQELHFDHYIHQKKAIFLQQHSGHFCMIACAIGSLL